MALGPTHPLWQLVQLQPVLTVQQGHTGLLQGQAHLLTAFSVMQEPTPPLLVPVQPLSALIVLLGATESLQGQALLQIAFFVALGNTLPLQAPNCLQLVSTALQGPTRVL